MTTNKIEFEIEKELKANSSKYLELIINNAPLIYFILNDEGIFLTSRGKGLQDMGLLQDQIVGLSAFELYKEFNEMVIAIKKALSGNVSYHSSYVKETDRYYRTTIIPIEQMNGKNFVLGISVDETLSMRYQNELIKKERRINELKELEIIGKLGTGLAHEFNNILQAIIGIADLIDLKVENNSSELKELVDRLRIIAYRGKEIPSQLLSISNLQLPKKELININKLISDYKEFAEIQLKNKDIKLQLQLLDEPLTIESNDSQLRLILSNLISNSFDAIEEKGKITIVTEKMSNNKVLMRFSNNGPPIKEENLSKIFELFHSTKTKGMGIGLATVKSIVNQYNGTIRVKNQEEGVLFEIEFPLIENSFSIQKQKISNLSLVKNKFVGKIIIVIDDELTILQSIEQFFKELEFNCEIHVFTSALKAKEFIYEIKKKKADLYLVISDILIPYYTGIDLLKNLREDEYYKNTQFLLISGYSNQFYEESNEILTKNVKFLAKPFTKKDLFSVLIEID